MAEETTIASTSSVALVVGEDLGDGVAGAVGDGRAGVQVVGDVSAMGGLSTLIAKRYGLAGNVVDCGVRDVEEMRKLDYPVWSRGVTPITGKFRFEALMINGPVVCAGVSVHPGDVVVADDTGVVVIPRDISAGVIRKAILAARREAELTEVIEDGASLREIKKVLSPEKW